MRRLHRTLMLFLLAWLPIQAAGVPLLVAGCCPDVAVVVVAEAPCHQHAAMDDDGAPAGDRHDGGQDNPGHLCCPHFSAAAAHRLTFGPSAVRFDPPSPLLAVRSHVPEQPQRPPRP